MPILIKAQTYTATVINAQTKQALPFVNIGIIEKNIGTVSDNNGKFTLTINDDINTDSLRFSMIGYEPETINVTEFKKNAETNNAFFALSEKIITLNTVSVAATALKSKTLGNKGLKGVGVGFLSNDLGSEVGVVIPIKKIPTIIKALSFTILSNKYDTLFFRINVYQIKNGLPANNLLPQNVFTKIINEKEGTFEIDLSPYNLEVDGDILISLEWLSNFFNNSKEANKLSFSGTMLGAKCMYRKTSMGSWQLAPFPFGIGFLVNAKQ